MTAVCPAGHTSSSDDYCDVCGMPIEQGAAPATAAPVQPSSGSASSGGSAQQCPNCDTPNVADALFCEACGYDFTTGTMPRPLLPPSFDLSGLGGGVSPAPGGPAPSANAPTSVDAPSTAPAPTGQSTVTPAGTSPAPDAAQTWVAEVWIDPAWYEAQESPDPLPSAGLPAVFPLRGRSLLVGRVSQSRNIHPDVDCGTDSGVSRRQSQLTTDGSRWWVEDLESANGTFVGPAAGALPEDAIPVGQKIELKPDDRVYVGAWTRIVIRPATEDELAG